VRRGAEQLYAAYRRSGLILEEFEGQKTGTRDLAKQARTRASRPDPKRLQLRSQRTAIAAPEHHDFSVVLRKAQSKIRLPTPRKEPLNLVSDKTRYLTK
jgi:hypothetical protein